MVCRPLQLAYTHRGAEEVSREAQRHFYQFFGIVDPWVVVLGEVNVYFAREQHQPFGVGLYLHV